MRSQGVVSSTLYFSAYFVWLKQVNNVLAFLMWEFTDKLETDGKKVKLIMRSMRDFNDAYFDLLMAQPLTQFSLIDFQRCWIFFFYYYYSQGGVALR